MMLAAACDPERSGLRVPFRIDDWIVGTDAYLLVAERGGAQAAPAPDWATGLCRLLADGDNADWISAQTAELRVVCGRPLLPEACPCCDGYGNWLSSTFKATDCEQCDGTGCILERRPESDLAIVFGGLAFDRRLIASALVHVEAETVELRNLKSVGVLQLRWDGGDKRAAVMSLKDRPEPWMEYLA